MAFLKTVSFWQIIIYSIGVIVGTGIYTLIGIGAGIAGNLLWLSFIIAGIIASLTALSYAKLSSLFVKESAESFYAQRAFGSKKISFLVGYLSLIVWVFSGATVAWGLAAYAKAITPIAPLFIAIGSIIIISIINFLGVQKSVMVNNLLTIITILGLFVLIIFGIPFIGQVNFLDGIDGTNLIENSFSLSNSIFSAAALIFFAFLGFEGIVNISEETKNPKKSIPKAILLSLFFVTILYVLISMIAVSVIPPTELYNATLSTSTSEGPLALVAESILFPGAGLILTLIAFCAIGSTLIVILNVSSRIVYGLSKQNLAPKMFEYLNPKTNTPTVAILLITILTCLFALIGNIELLSSLCTMGIFLLFGIINISVIFIQRELTPFEYNKPLINKENILPLLGAAFCFFMLLTQYWKTTLVFGIELPLIALLIIALLIGRILYFLFVDRK
jgi:basic amino acid/polyamine antiporter, APA family